MIVDIREHNLIKQLKERNVIFETSRLDIGDIILNRKVEKEHDVVQSIYDREVESESEFRIEKLVIERKTIEDLAASIKDGRYREQKERMKCSGNEIMYIFEGPIKERVNGIPRNTLMKAILNCIYRDKFYTLRTENLTETADALIMLESICAQNASNSKCAKQNNRYTPIHIEKKKNMTNEMVYLLQLSCIPGISIEIAKKISTIWPDMSTLYESHKNEENLKKRKRLTTCIDGIGSVLSERIYISLFNCTNIE